jgi:hypothetical protein
MLVFLGKAVENLNEYGNVEEILDYFLSELVLQCEFIGYDAAAERLRFVLKLRDIVRVDGKRGTTPN